MPAQPSRNSAIRVRTSVATSAPCRRAAAAITSPKSSGGASARRSMSESTSAAAFRFLDVASSASESSAATSGLEPIPNSLSEACRQNRNDVKAKPQRDPDSKPKAAHGGSPRSASTHPIIRELDGLSLGVVNYRSTLLNSGGERAAPAQTRGHWMMRCLSQGDLQHRHRDQRKPEHCGGRYPYHLRTGHGRLLDDFGGSSRAPSFETRLGRPSGGPQAHSDRHNSGTERASRFLRVPSDTGASRIVLGATPATKNGPRRANGFLRGSVIVLRREQARAQPLVKIADRIMTSWPAPITARAASAAGARQIVGAVASSDMRLADRSE
jgi:hypothetical protein